MNNFTMIPPYAVLDPEVTYSLPPSLTATTGMDALTHAVEAFIGNSTTKETKKYSLEAIRLIFDNTPLKTFVKNDFAIVYDDLVDGKTEYDLLHNYINKDGKRYASDENYEKNWDKLSHNRPAHKNWFPKHRMPKWLLLLMLIVMSPLALVAGVVTLPLWLAWLIIRWAIKDPAFHNSVQFVWQLIIIPLTGFIAMPFWMFLQEYMYLARKLNKPEETK